MGKHRIGFGLVLVAMACQGSTQTHAPQPSAALTQGDDADGADAHGKPVHHGTVSPADKMAPPSGYGSAIAPQPKHPGANAGYGGMGGMDGGAGTGGFGGVGGVGGVIEPVAAAGVTRASQ